MSLQYFEENYFFFIKMSFYHNIVCKNIVCDVGLYNNADWLKFPVPMPTRKKTGLQILKPTE